MKIILATKTEKRKLPLKLTLSFEKVFRYFEEVAGDSNHVLHETAVKLLKENEHNQELKEGFQDLDKLFKYEKEIDRLLDVLFPDLLQTNEIKAASIPFEFTMFKMSRRFEEIIEKSGDDELFLRNFEDDKLYILSCTFILAYCYGEYFDFKRPFYYDIKDHTTGLTNHFRAMFNGDFFEVIPHESAPKLTQEDINELRDNFDNLEVWLEKFPPNSYEFKGFGIVNLFDVTVDQAIAEVNKNLLQRDVSTFKELEQSIARLYRSDNLNFGFSIYTINGDKIFSKHFNENYSYLHREYKEGLQEECECDDVTDMLFNKRQMVSVSNLDLIQKPENKDHIYNILDRKGIKSFILVPITFSEDQLGIMELVSDKYYELNSVNANKLKDVIPGFELATRQFMEEYVIKLESIIQEHYTAIHPSVKWKFYEKAEQFLLNMEHGAEISLDNISFQDVMPLYGQSDIRNSSVFRNRSIQQDLMSQLEHASSIMAKANEKFALPIYSELASRIETNLLKVKDKLNSGDEKEMVDFLKKEIYPVFSHLKGLDKELAGEIKFYMDLIDEDLQVLSNKRKQYESSVNLLNEHLARFIDAKQLEAQKMFPHLFERYKTDGIEYNMYIGASLVNDGTYHPIYLQNLRLWQLQMMCELENEAYSLKDQLEHPLEVASLILAHNSPMTIEFRMDEKRFDVGGAYNIRYEIIKKRIDKAKIKGTNERLTQPGKIAVVYSQEKDANEYMSYIRHLQRKGLIHDGIENLDIEESQGISGLKALRFDVVKKESTEKNVSFEELIKVIKNP